MRLHAAAVVMVMLATACGGGGSEKRAAAITGRPAIATLLSADAVVEPAVGNRYTNPGAVVLHQGRFHMFRNSFQDWPGPSVVSHLVSSDGIAWSEPAAKPVFASAKVPYTKGNAFFMSALVADDGTWIAYLYTYDGKTAPGHIGRATAPAAGGPWTVDPNPVLSPGPSGSWDAARVVEPSVVRTTDGYAMYYSGIDAEGVARIGRATSRDGITWTKDDAPVLEGAAEWTGKSIGCPQVIRTGDAYLMTFDAADARFKIGMATSGDGISWTVADDPIMDLTMSPGRLPIWQSELVERDGALYWWLEAGPGASATDVFALRLDRDAGTRDMRATARVDTQKAVVIDVQATGFSIAFDPSDTSGTTAHVHAFVDRPPPAHGEAIPLDTDGIVHSKTSPITVTGLSSGTHTIWVVAADGADRAMLPPRALRLDVTIP